MANERQSLSVNSLDFANIKSNIKDYLANQETFSDYDFEGSGLSVLLDILSYYTHYQGVYNNLVANELFIDSAVKRSSVVSHAKSLGYTPRSRTSAVATVDILSNDAFDPVNEGGKAGVLPKNSVLTGIGENQTFYFYTTKSAEYTQLTDGTEGTGQITDLEIKEGSIKNATFVCPSSLTKDQRFRLPDNNIDTSSIVVQVFESSSDSTGIEDVWTNADSLISLTPTSKVYFIQEDFDGVYSVGFGDDVLGQKLSAGNVISISYVKSNGSNANDVGKNETTSYKPFTLDSASAVTTKSFAAGGADRESIESIRRNAPKSFSAQNRAVTTSDFETIINSNFSGFRSVYVYGGEDASPPQFGKVLITLNPNIGTTVPSSLKTSIESFLTSRCSVGTTPTVVDADPIFFRYSANVIYSDTATVLDAQTLSTLIQSQIRTFFRQNTVNFNTSVSITQMEKRVLDTLPEVSTVDISPVLEKRFVPIEDRSSDYQIKFKTSIFHPHSGHESVVSSNEFFVLDQNSERRLVTISDDGNGTLIATETINGVESVVYSNFGSVNYVNGQVNFISARLFTTSEGVIKVRVQVAPTQISATENTIFSEDPTDITAAQIRLFVDNRPDRKVLDETLADNTFVGTSSITTTSTTTTTSSYTSSTTTSSTSSGSGQSGNGSGGGGYGGGY